MITSLRIVVLFSIGIILENQVSIGSKGVLLSSPMIILYGVVLIYLPNKGVVQRVQMRVAYLLFVLLCGYINGSISDRIWERTESFRSAKEFVYGELIPEEQRDDSGPKRYRLRVQAVGAPDQPPLTVRPYDIYLRLDAKNNIVWSAYSPGPFDVLNPERVRDKLSPSMKGWYYVQNRSFAPLDNPGQFNTREYFRSQNIRYESELLALYTGPDYVQSPSMPERIREKGINLLKEGELTQAKMSGIFQALIWGKKSEIDPHHRNIFNLIGLGHIIAVSGLHVGILLLPVALFWKKAQQKSHYRTGIASYWASHAPYRLVLALLMGMLLLLYAAFTGFSISVIRATFMAFAHVLLISLGARSNTLNSLAWSGLCILLWQPNQLMRPGFQLSFSAVFVLIYLAPYLQRIRISDEGKNSSSTRKEKNPKQRKGLRPQNRNLFILDGLKSAQQIAIRAIITAFLVSFVLQLFLLPLQVYYFEQISWVAPFVNALVLPLFSMALPLAMLGNYWGVFFGVTTWSKAALEPLAYLLERVIFYGDRLINWRFSWTAVIFPDISHSILIACTLIILLLLFIRHFIQVKEGAPKRGRIDSLAQGRVCSSAKSVKSIKSALYIGAFSVVILAGVRVQNQVDPGLRVVFMRVGQGDAILVVLPNQRSMLIDSGPVWSDGMSTASRIKGVLNYFGLRQIDLLIHTHPHADHIGASRQLISEGIIREVMFNGLPYGSRTHQGWINAAKDRKIDVHAKSMGDLIKLDPTTFIQVLSPSMLRLNSNEPNNLSLVIRIQYGSNTLLLTGDAEKETERMLVAIYGHLLNADILKAGHHGSKTSTTPGFIQKVQPERVLISAGKNNYYDHPSPELLTRLDAQNIPYWDLSQSPALYVVSDGARWREVSW